MKTFFGLENNIAATTYVVTCWVKIKFAALYSKEIEFFSYF